MILAKINARSSRSIPTKIPRVRINMKQFLEALRKIYSILKRIALVIIVKVLRGRHEYISVIRDTKWRPKQYARP